MKNNALVGVLLASSLFGSILFGGCSEKDAKQQSDALVVYAGRSKSLVEPAFDRFTEKTGIPVEVRHASTSELAIALAEEGSASRADVFWAQDAGALGSVSAAGMLDPLPTEVQAAVTERYRSSTGDWIAISGRARTLAYSPERTADEQRPMSVFELTDSRFRNRVGWAPLNASFHSFVSAMREVHGDAVAREWLTDMKANGAVSFSNNSSIVRGIADGEVDYGLPNHYYLLRFKNEDNNFPVEQEFFQRGDTGNLVNIAGVGILQTSKNKDAAMAFVQFLLSPEMQDYFAETTFEYPVIGTNESVSSAVNSSTLDSLSPTLDLNALRDLEATMEMLREEEIL